MHIDPARLRELREQRGWSRAQLEQKTKGKHGEDGERLASVAARTITRLENGECGSPRASTARSLAAALGVEPAVLSGEASIPQSKPSRDDGPTVQINALIRSEYRLAYGLVGRRYGVTARALIEMAPLFFTLLAEGSLKWRRKKLAEAREAIERLEAQHDRVGRLPYGLGAWRAGEIADAEEASIEQGDVFGRKVPEVAHDLGDFDPDDANPFIDYLQKLEREIAAPDRVTINGLGGSELDDFPAYELCESDLERITAGSARARHALRNGHARLGDIPDELRGDDASAARAAWLEAKVPEDEWASWTSLLASFDLSLADGPEEVTA